MAHILSDFDDLTVVSSRAPDPDAFTLCTIGRNEMYFLPAFLEHYRKLGIEQFAVLNDCSDDGTRDYLLAQPDVVLFESNYAYGDTVNLPSGMSEQVSNGRILYVWRALLFDRFARSGWAVQLDMDEFVHLPPNTRFQDVARTLEKENASAALGLMVDVYPSDIGALARQASDTEIDLGSDWYFDGGPHLKLRENRAARVLHAGARAFVPYLRD
ncbi:MAG: glycosyltransferase family 2 protein [Litoreibacter sp.]|nr:glycosyltransferase family 2 protein [Litoreibacter sp.]